MAHSIEDITGKGVNSPVLPKLERKQIIYEEENKFVAMAKLSGFLKEFCLNDKSVENVNQFYSQQANKHVIIITYYE